MDQIFINATIYNDSANIVHKEAKRLQKFEATNDEIYLIFQEELKKRLNMTETEWQELLESERKLLEEIEQARIKQVGSNTILIP